ncbi:MAG: hypothetical protein ACT4QB_06560 [Gammaproteobacteria bacterium]
MVARRIAVSRRLVCCSPEYARRAGLPETIEALARHACIGWPTSPRATSGSLNRARPPARYARRWFGAESS